MHSKHHKMLLNALKKGKIAIGEAIITEYHRGRDGDIYHMSLQ